MSQQEFGYSAPTAYSTRENSFRRRPEILERSGQPDPVTLREGRKKHIHRQHRNQRATEYRDDRPLQPNTPHESESAQRDGKVEERSAGVGKDQRNRENNSRACQNQPGARPPLARTKQRDRNHYQKKCAIVPERAGLVK